MKIGILGASGQTGQLLVNLALEAGHIVTAVVRSPEKITISNPNLHIVKGDAKDSTLLTTAFGGQDAILSTLGISMSNPDYTLMQESALAIIKAANANKIKRVIIMSTYAAATDQLETAFKLMIGGVMGNVVKDVLVAKKYLESSTLDWTLVYAVGLTNDAKTGNERVVASDEKVGFGNKIARADVADFLLKQLSSQEFVRQTVLLNGK